jgi:glutamate synthase (NADPH/NADH) small chain
MSTVKNIHTIPKGRTPMAEQEPRERGQNFEEVALGYSLPDALREADRCIECKKPRCIAGSRHRHPGFIRAIAQQDMRKAYEILRQDNPLPAVCGRVCPQESQCEVRCIVGVKAEPVCIGRLERFAADYAMAHFEPEVLQITPARKKAAIIGSGPAGIACAADLARAGVDVTIFDALHMAGGVLKYGIPEFRLPKSIVDREIDLLKQMGVKIELNTVIGSCTPSPSSCRKRVRRRLHRDGVRVPQVPGDPGREPERRLLGQRVPDPRESDAGVPPSRI